VVKAVGEEAWARFRSLGRPLDRETIKTLSPMLILAPHPDDETLGCGGLIATGSQLRLRPRVAYLTDGAASHPGSRAWPRGRLAAERRDEALEALRVLGVPGDDVIFLGWPDAAPYGPQDRPYAETLSALVDVINDAGIRSLWAPWSRESHGDHVAAARLAEAAARMTGVIVMSYLVWGWENPRLDREIKSDTVWTLDCPRTIPRRRRALACHRTQTTAMITDADPGFRIPPQLAALAERPAEVFLQAVSTP
jgi:LmbE family N-acetylglucosaminyl deacetylase